MYRNPYISLQEYSQCCFDIKFNGNHYTRPKIIMNNECKKLVLPRNFNFHLTYGSLPPTITTLDFGHAYCQPIDVGVIPPSVENLKLSFHFNDHLEVGAIPSSVINLTLGHKFNKPLKIGVIPPSVTNLQFGLFYNQLLEPNVIPRSVTHLTFGKNFNQPLIPNVIPLSVTFLKFGKRFNQPLDSTIIPNTCIDLYLHQNYFRYHNITWRSYYIYKEKLCRILTSDKISLDHIDTNIFTISNNLSDDPKISIVKVTYIGN